MSECKSCIGCKFLYGDGSGYSNYTWEETGITCALGKNPALPKDQPYDWEGYRSDPPDPTKDNLEATQNGRCGYYSPGPYITLDPDREGKVYASKWRTSWDPYAFADQEQLDAIWKSDEFDGDPMPLAEYLKGGRP